MFHKPAKAAEWIDDADQLGRAFRIQAQQVTEQEQLKHRVHLQRLRDPDDTLMPSRPVIIAPDRMPEATELKLAEQDK